MKKTFFLHVAYMCSHIGGGLTYGDAFTKINIDENTKFMVNDLRNKALEWAKENNAHSDTLNSAILLSVSEISEDLYNALCH